MRHSESDQRRGDPRNIAVKLKEMARHHPLYEWEQRTRKAFRMDD